MVLKKGLPLVPEYLVDYEGKGEKNKRVWYIYNARTRHVLEDNLTLEEARRKLKRLNR